MITNKIIYLWERLSLLILLLIVGGCAYGHIKPEDVKEYRYFPEYRGYFPIAQFSPAKYNPPKVQADWVLPVITPDGRLDYTPPQTPEEAEQRVKQKAEKYKIPHPIIGFPLGVALFPVGVGSYFVFNPILMLTDEHPVKLQHKQLKQLEEFVGIKVKIQIVDESGAPIPNARIIEMTTPVEVPIFVNKDGIRTFAPPEIHSYTLYDTRMLKLIAEHLPICLLSVKEFYLVRGCRDTFDQRADVSGKAIYTNLSAGRFARYSEKEKKWYWQRSQPPLALSFIVWSPGFKPSIYTFPDVKVGDEINLTAILESLPDRFKVEKIISEFEHVLNCIPKAIDIKAYKTKIDAQAVKDITKKLEGWIQDESLPSYIRWNAYKLLEQISYFLSSDKALKKEVKSLLGMFKKESESLTPYLVDSPYNPWRLKERYEKLFFEPITTIETGKIYELYEYKEVKIESKVVNEAQDILSKALDLNPNIPELDNLRVIIALSEGDRERALSLSRYLPHRHFFRLFYGLSLSEP